MSLNESLIAELQHEAATTRRMLERLPENEFDWKPHDKSMSLRQLATHIAEMLTWLPFTIHEDELDFAAMDYKPPIIDTTAGLLEFFDKNLAQGIEGLRRATDEQFAQIWTMRNGEQVFMRQPKSEIVRGMVMNHIVHHRGQLSVYMRLLGVSVPAIYGPSADEQAF